MNDATVTISSISKRFGRIQAVEDVSFEIFPGEIFGLLGPNGAGKTTAIRMMMDIFKPDTGSVSVLGGVLDQARKRRVGYLPEERGLYKDMKLAPTLVFLATLKGLDKSVAEKRVAEWLQRFDLHEHRQKQIQELSKGMQQKAQIIATLVHNPELIVIDEPFSGLDPVNTRLVKEILEEERRAGKSIVMSTHQMYQVEALCNRIVLINRGRSVLYGEVGQIKRNFAGNAIHLEGEGDFDQLPGVLDTRRMNGTWQMSLQPGSDPQLVFQALAARAGTRIERFEVAEPSVEDIFVAIVQGAKVGLKESEQEAEAVYA